MMAACSKQADITVTVFYLSQCVFCSSSTLLHYTSSCRDDVVCGEQALILDLMIFSICS